MCHFLPTKETLQVKGPPVLMLRHDTAKLLLKYLCEPALKKGGGCWGHLSIELLTRLWALGICYEDVGDKEGYGDIY